MAKTNTITERPLTLPASDRPWEVFLAAIAGRALAHTRAMIASDPSTLGAWKVELKSERARLSPDSVLIKLNMRHGCGARLTLAKVIDRGPDMDGGLAEATADNMVAAAIQKASGHSRHCHTREVLRPVLASPPAPLSPVAQATRDMMDSAALAAIPQTQYIPTSAPKATKRKPKAKACVLCGTPDDEFPLWDDDCNHTPTERRGK